MKQIYLVQSHYWSRMALIAVLGVLLAGPAAADRQGWRSSASNRASGAWAARTDTCRQTRSRPEISGVPATTAAEGAAYLFTPMASDPNCDKLFFRISGRPDWASFSTADGTLSGTPPPGSAGSYGPIRIWVSNGRRGTSLPSFTITVVAADVPVAAPVPPTANRAPTISGTPATRVTSGQDYSFTPTASDLDKDPLTFSIRNMPGWARFDVGTGQLSGRPSVTVASEFVDIAISVSDGKATSSLPPFGILVTVPNRAPTIAGTPPATATVGQRYSFVPRAGDADGDKLQFMVAGQPTWLSINRDTGELAGTPPAAAAGLVSNIRISVTDGVATASLPAFSITVQQVATGSATLSWLPPTQRTDGSALTNLAGYHIRYGNAPDRLDRDIPITNPGLTSYVVDNLSQGTWYFAMTAFDAAGLVSDPTAIRSKTIP
jgi:hypothetical protein